MPQAAVNTEEHKKLVMMGKKRPMNFAYGPNPKEGDVFLIDRRKPPEVLFRLVKKEGAKKVASGTFTVKSKNLMVTAQSVLPGFAKKLRKHLKSLNLKMSVVVLDPEGNPLESDLDEEAGPEDQAPAQEAEAQDQEADGRAQEARALAARLKALKPRIDALGPAAAPLTKAAGTAVTFLKGGELDRTEAALDKIEAGLRTLEARAAAQTERPAEAQKAPQPAPPEATPAAPDAKALVARAAALKEQVAQAPGPAGAAAKKGLVEAMGLLKARDLPGAEAALEKAEAQLAEAQAEPQAEEAPQPDPAQAQWDDLLRDLQPQVERAIAEKRGDPDKLLRAFDFAKGKAEAGDYQSALKAGQRVAAHLESAQADAPGSHQARDAEALTPENVAAFTRSRLNWVTTRSDLKAQLAKIQMAIVARTRGIEGLEEVAEQTEALFDYVEEIDQSLETTLDALVATPDGAERQKLKGEAARIVRSYRDTLDSDFFQAVDQNGFTKTNIRAAALGALDQVDSALAT
jgi:hypothetical protein